MSNIDFSIVDSVGGLLDKHKDRLGPFHQPLSILLGAVIFMLIFAALIGMPLLLDTSFRNIALVQFTLVAVYFMLLVTIKQSVSDRFVFCLVLFVVAAAGPVLITNESFLNVIREDNGSAAPLVVKLLKDLPKQEVFLYAFLRGLGNVLWSIPLLFMFYTFYPLYEKVGKDRIRVQARNAAAIALFLQAAAAVMVPWLGGAAKGFAELSPGLGNLGGKIQQYQTAYLVFFGLYLAVGFLTVLAARFGFGGDDRRWLAIVAAGLVICQTLYVISSYNGQQVNRRFPGAVTTANAVDIYRLESEAKVIVFTNSRLRKISSKTFNSYVTYAVCEGCDGEFSFKVMDQDVFYERFMSVDEDAISDPEFFFCPSDAPKCSSM